MAVILIALIPLSSLALAGKPLVNCNLTLDRDILPAGRNETTVIKVTLDVPEIPREEERPPVNLTLVIDRSGSMSGQKLAKAREAAITALRMLGPRDIFSLVAYDDRVETLIPPQYAANQKWMEARIRAIDSGGNTALFGAVSQGAAEVRKNLERGYIHRLILLSDGLANVGPSSPADLARLGSALLKEGISVSTIGVGNDFNEDLMTQLAERSDGNHYFVESSRDLPRIFASELGDVLSVAARRVIIEIDCPDGVRPLRIIGRDGRIRDNRVELHLNQLYGGQEKYALIEVAVDPGRADESRQLAAARCAYENALTSSAEESRSEIHIAFSSSDEDVIRSANKGVQQALIENEIAESRDKALDLYNEGRKDEAVAELQQSKEKIQTRSSALGFSDLADEAQELEQDAEAFAAPVLPSPVKKAIRSESYKVRSQQKDY
ncbi:MAG: hypothetical protein C0622_06970 [Desulfuromonas sp.]|nr:MAG: hypothetical protein C0622_06970 [Desulfuromonas sp.]